MGTLHRIVKYTPAVVLGLLIAAWLGSAFGWAEYLATINQRNFVAVIDSGTFEVRTYLDTDPATTARGLGYGRYGELGGSWENSFAGSFGYYREAGYDYYTTINFPMPFFITLLLPVAIGPFISFRFRIWQYLAYTALIAVELAYYLRWQG